MKRVTAFLLCIVAVGMRAAEPPMLKLTKTISLPGVKGLFDHFAIDASGRRLFVAALGNNSLEIQHGEDVSFNSILKKFSLTDPALVLVGEIVRAADSHLSKPHPAGEELRWVAFGLSDHEIIEREFVVYDALFAGCKRRARETTP
jgi:hypothetical protein